MEQPSFSPDLPITSASEDRLNRSRFALSLASAIQNWSQSSSLVIALYGDWGSGKSSVKNMILEYLEAGAEPKNQLTVMEFNPWQISDQDNLARMFFDEIGSVLGQDRHGEAREVAERRAANWKTYSAYFSIGGSITKSLKVLLPILGVPLVGDALDVALEGLTRSAAIVKEGAEGIESKGKAAGGTLQQLKRLVADSLKSLCRPILVVLDDVDRLAHQEIRLLFQLIKANADFPNLIYLVLAQRSTIVKALDPIAPGQGDAFLEKIVQVGFNIPRIPRRQLEKVLFSGLDRLLSIEGVSIRFDQARWADLYQEGLHHFFRNLRDVNRYLSSLDFHVGVFRSQNTLEVNPVDLIALEVLRVFVPQVYDGLAGAKHILTDAPRLPIRDTLDQDIAFLHRIISGAAEEDREATTNIIKRLFPPASQLLRGSSFSGRGAEDFFYELRAASHDVFDRYFHFAALPDDISQQELDEIIALRCDRDALAGKFKDLSDRNLLDTALDRLDSYRLKLPLECTEPFITALLDLNVEDTDELLTAEFSPQTHIQRIIYGLLRRDSDHARRTQILLNAIRETISLYTPALAIAHLTASANSLDPDELLTNPGDVEVVRSAIVARVREAALTGQLARQKNLKFLLYRWRSWGEALEVTEWIRSLILTDDGLLLFINAVRSTSTVFSGSIHQEKYYYNLNDIEHFVSIAELKARIQSLSEAELPPATISNLNLLKMAFEKKTNNNSGSSCLDID